MKKIAILLVVILLISSIPTFAFYYTDVDEGYYTIDPNRKDNEYIFFPSDREKDTFVYKNTSMELILNVREDWYVSAEAVVITKDKPEDFPEGKIYAFLFHNQYTEVKSREYNCNFCKLTPNSKVEGIQHFVTYQFLNPEETKYYKILNDSHIVRTATLSNFDDNDSEIIFSTPLVAHNGNGGTYARGNNAHKFWVYGLTAKDPTPCTKIQTIAWFESESIDPEKDYMQETIDCLIDKEILFSKTVSLDDVLGADGVKKWYDSLTTVEISPFNHAGFTDYDAETAWFAPSVFFVRAKHLMYGTSKDTFSPYLTIDRATVATLLLRLDKFAREWTDKPTYNIKKQGFTDLKQDWYKDAVNWVTQENILKGNSKDTFNPNGTITRQELMQAVYNFLKYRNIKTEKRIDISKFVDHSDIKDEYKEAVSFCVATKIVTGKDGNRLDPNGTTTRAEFATIMNRLDNFITAQYYNYK